MRSILFSLACAPTALASATVTIGSQVINTVAPEFLSFTMDIHTPDQACHFDGKSCWAPNASFLVADTTHPRLLNAAKHLSPAFLRVGGSPGDRVTYDVGSTKCKSNEFYCLRMNQWDGWLNLAHEADVQIIYGLNYLDRTSNGKWDKTNAMELIDHTYSKFSGSPPILGFELGNELSTRGPTPSEVVNGYKELRSAIDHLSVRVPPKIAGPDCGIGGPNNPKWVKSFLEGGGAQYIDIATYHYYGRQSDPSIDLASQILSGSVMDEEHKYAKKNKAFFDDVAPGKELWLGEGALAALSGYHGVTDRFADTLWYMVRLGELAANGHSVYARQTLIGGYYSMFDHLTLRPHPDWWAAVLHKRLMGARVLGASSTDSNVRAFAHCAKEQLGAVAVSLVNIAGSDRSVSFDGVDLSGSLDEYCLTSDKLDSDNVRLNGGSNLKMADSGAIPDLRPHSSQSNTVVMPAHSVCFVTLPNAAASVCGSSPSPAPDTRRRRSSPTPTPPPTPTSGDHLSRGDVLGSGEALTSAGGARLKVQGDGNVVLRDSSDHSVWSTKTAGNAGATLHFQSSDGNLVVQSADGKTLWSSESHADAVSASIQDDCNFVVKDASGHGLWSTGTSCNSEYVEVV